MSDGDRKFVESVMNEEVFFFFEIFCQTLLPYLFGKEKLLGLVAFIYRGNQKREVKD